MVATIAAVTVILIAPVVGAEAGGTEVFHGRVHPIRGAGGQAVTNSLMTYHGGPISSAPVVYINYWGSQWNTGFSTGGYTSAQAQTYVNGFFGNVGGSSWGQIDVQYCQGVSVGATSCPATGVTHVGNQTGLLGGTWVDTTSLPKRIT